MADVTLKVFTCTDTSQAISSNPLALPGREWGTCATGKGAWTTITVPEKQPVMDIETVIIVAVLVLAAALGYVAGQQR